MNDQPVIADELSRARKVAELDSRWLLVAREVEANERAILGRDPGVRAVRRDQDSRMAEQRRMSAALSRRRVESEAPDFAARSAEIAMSPHPSFVKPTMAEPTSFDPRAMIWPGRSAPKGSGEGSWSSPGSGQMQIAESAPPLATRRPEGSTAMDQQLRPSCAK